MDAMRTIGLFAAVALFPWALFAKDAATAQTAEAAPRPLRVALYPYVPDIDVFKDALTNAWSGTGREEPIEFVAWDCYNEEFPTNADVVVSECGFLASWVANGFLRPLDEAPLAGAANPDDFIGYALDGCHGMDATGAVHLYGYPQMICTYYVFVRRGDAMPSGFDFAPLPEGQEEPGRGTGLLFYATGDDMTMGIVRLYLDRALGDERRGGAAFAKIASAAGGQLAFYPDDGDGFLRADWFRDGRGAGYIDYSEALSRLARDNRGDDFAFRRLVEFDTPYFVNPVSVTAFCPDELLPAAAECLGILVGRDYLSAVLWPEGRNPAYVLPGRKDVFADFAARDKAYSIFRRDALLPGNHTWRLPANAKETILDAAARSR